MWHEDSHKKVDMWKKWTPTTDLFSYFVGKRGYRIAEYISFSMSLYSILTIKPLQFVEKMRLVLKTRRCEYWRKYSVCSQKKSVKLRT